MYKTDTIYLHKWWDIPLEYHPTKTGKIIINIPGAGGSVNGYKNKYVNLGNYVQESKLASFVRIPNDRPQDFTSAVRKAINYSLEHSEKICGAKTSEIWLMGFSAGGASAILVGWEYPEVTKILAINPFINIEKVRESIMKDLSEYTGELYIVTGDNDTVISPDTTKFIKKYATGVKDVQTHTIVDCDHQLKGETNSKRLSQLPEYYFLGEYEGNPFPDGSEGKYLLDE